MHHYVTPTGGNILAHEVSFLHSEAARAASDAHTIGYQAGEVARQAGALRRLLYHGGAALYG